MMDHDKLLGLVALGEDSRRQFKAQVTNADSLAAEMVALSNSDGGIILIGVADDGTIPGLTRSDVRRINQLIGNAATQHMRSPISPTTENIPAEGGRVVIALSVPEGIDKPYFDRQGVIWVKTGSDRRRILSKEELRRLFQDVDLLHADEVPTQLGIDGLDRLRFRDFLSEAYGEELPESPQELGNLLENMNLARGSALNLAGLLLFGRHPQRAKPAFIVKAVRYPGTEIDASHYLDSEDLEGTLRTAFDGTMGFILRNLPKVQGRRGVNEPGKLPVSRAVFEELLVNALVHRDYFVQAPVRLFIYDDRVEVLSPGSLPNHLTVAKIRAGNSVIRNPILASFAAKGVLPYRGLGTGIRRALAEWPDIEFLDDRDACTFAATVWMLEARPGGKPAPRTLDKSTPENPHASGNAPEGEPGAPINEPSASKNGLSEPINEPNASRNGSNEPINEPRNELNASIDASDVGRGEPINQPDGPASEPLKPELTEIQRQILELVRTDPSVSQQGVAARLRRGKSTIMRNMNALKSAGILRRSGSKKTGHWEVLREDF